jgi:hypothetical protein
VRSGRSLRGRWRRLPGGARCRAGRSAPSSTGWRAASASDPGRVAANACARPRGRWAGGRLSAACALAGRAAHPYDGWPLALAAPDRVHLHPTLDALAQGDASHPRVRFACAPALHAFEIHAGLIEGPVDQARTERCARELLMPAGDFARLAGLADGQLAELFGVPVEQVGGEAP